jgi:hypothetical protein
MDLFEVGGGSGSSDTRNILKYPKNEGELEILKKINSKSTQNEIIVLFCPKNTGNLTEETEPSREKTLSQNNRELKLRLQKGKNRTTRIIHYPQSCFAVSRICIIPGFIFCELVLSSNLEFHLFGAGPKFFRPILIGNCVSDSKKKFTILFRIVTRMLSAPSAVSTAGLSKVRSSKQNKKVRTFFGKTKFKLDQTDQNGYFLPTCLLPVSKRYQYGMLSQ